MKSLFINILMFFVIGSAALSLTAFGQEAEWFDEDTPRLTEAQRSKIRQLNEEFRALTDPIARRDRRNAQGKIEGVKYAQITTVLVNAVREQQVQIETQNTSIRQ